MSRPDALLAFMNFFTKEPSPSIESLQDGNAFQSVFEYLSGTEFPQDSATSQNAWFVALKKLRAVYQKLQEAVKGTHYDRTVDVTSIARRGDVAQISSLVIMMIGFALKSDKKKETIEKIKGMAREHQIVMKEILTKPKAAAPESEPEKAAQEAPAAPETPKPTEDDKVNELKAELAALNHENASAREANQALQKEIEDIRSRDDTAEKPTLAQLAEVKAKIYPIEVAIGSKEQKLGYLEDIGKQLEALLAKVEAGKAEASKLEQELTASESKGPDYSVLTERLQQLNLDPRQQEIDKLLEETKEMRKKLRALNTHKQKLQMKVDGQQGLAVLMERKLFLENLEATNTRRRERAELNLTLAQKRMRQDAFQMEMRSFI